jgi:anti-sigma B factor antagonist
MSLAFDRKDLDDAATLVTVRGRMLVGPEFRELESLVEELAKRPRTRLIFDLSSLVQIDSTGMGLFISTHGKLEKAGGELRLAGAHGAVQDAFHVTRLDTIFSFYPSTDAASAGLG